MPTTSRAPDGELPFPAADLTDAELEAVAAGKELLRPDMEGSNGWFVPLPQKLRRN